MKMQEVTIETLGLSARATNALKSNGVHTVPRLVGMTSEELLGLRWMGQISVDEVARALAQCGLALRQDVSMDTASPDDVSMSREVDRFVDAVLLARSCGLPTVSTMLRKCRADLILGGLPGKPLMFWRVVLTGGDLRASRTAELATLQASR